jgi:hypothetical protein
MSDQLKQIRTLYIDKTEVESGFGLRLVEALKELEQFELTGERSIADAVVQMHGQDADDGFVGELVLSDLHGRVLWSARAMRPHGEAGPMAYERLIDQLRQGLGK